MSAEKNNGPDLSHLTLQQRKRLKGMSPPALAYELEKINRQKPARAERNSQNRVREVSPYDVGNYDEARYALQRGEADQIQADLVSDHLDTWYEDPFRQKHPQDAPRVSPRSKSKVA